jgi:hypothetical protein
MTFCIIIKLELKIEIQIGGQSFPATVGYLISSAFLKKLFKVRPEGVKKGLLKCKPFTKLKYKLEGRASQPRLVI